LTDIFSKKDPQVLAFISTQITSSSTGSSSSIIKKENEQIEILQVNKDIFDEKLSSTVKN
jgi:hypothetical protein